MRSLVLTAARTLALAMWSCSVLPAVAAEREPLTINWYHKATFLQPVIDAFSKDSGIPVKVTDAYDKFDTDVILVSDYKTLTEAKKLNAFQPIRSPDLDAIVAPRWRDRDGYWYGVVLRARAVIYNKAQVKPGEIKSYADLADKKWRGKLALRPATSVYNRSLLASMIVHDGYAAALEWARAVRTNAGDNPEYAGDTANIWRVAKGEAALSFVNTYYINYEIARGSEQKNGIKLADNIGIAWLGQQGSGQHMNVTGVAVNTATTRKDDAMKLVRFLLSQKGQTLLSQHVFKYPVRADVAPHPQLQAWGDFRRDELNLNDLELHYDEADGIFRAVGWRAWLRDAP